MNNLILSQNGVYHLHQLANQVRSITGERYKLSNELSRFDLIRKSAASTHKVTQTYFAAFVSTLNEQQRLWLSDAGITSQPLAKAS